MAEMKMAEEEFGRHQSFSGLAIHYYDSYRTKVEETENQKPKH